VEGAGEEAGVPGPTATPGRKAGHGSEVIGPSGPVQTLDELLDEARECRKLKDWACAARAYRLIRQEYPSQPDGVTVLVPLAEIELDHLGEPKNALDHFELYLEESPGGSLSEMALYGKTRALGSLGLHEREAEALRAFLELHPSSVYAPKASERLENLLGAE
jgi:tetratricopeptide (TPR) repeat protein